LAVWESRENLGGVLGRDSDILVACSTDNGASWTEPRALNSNACTSMPDDTHPQVTTDGAGHWVAVWDSYDHLGGTIGPEQDILVATAFSPVGALRAGDIDGNRGVDAVDVQLVINAALGQDIGGLNADVNCDYTTDAVDVQLVIRAALGVNVSAALAACL